MKQPKNLYDVAKQTCHEAGLHWIDPRTGQTHLPPTVKKRVVRVSYKITLTVAEFKALVALGRNWGFTGTPLRIAKAALQNSGDSGCLSQINQYMKP